jgi:hypothetical protein
LEQVVDPLKCRLLQTDLRERNLARPLKAGAHVAQEVHHREGLAASVGVVNARNDLALERDYDPVD